MQKFLWGPFCQHNLGIGIEKVDVEEFGVYDKDQDMFLDLYLVSLHGYCITVCIFGAVWQAV